MIEQIKGKIAENREKVQEARERLAAIWREMGRPLPYDRDDFGHYRRTDDEHTALMWGLYGAEQDRAHRLALSIVRTDSRIQGLKEAAKAVCSHPEGEVEARSRKVAPGSPNEMAVYWRECARCEQRIETL